ncbi:MAG TPA: LysE family transporter [Candidatus Deferrimicrobium sp.]|nr:LysE family transporter [Candidatus Deferrimicrobium sp.]
MLSIILFYFMCYWISFALCIPLGPVNLEIFRTALRKHYPQAIAVAVGAACGDGIWAMVAFFGVSPFMSSPRMEALFLVITAVITMGLGIYTLKDSRFIVKKEEKMVLKIRLKRWAFLKGLTLVLLNPLGIASWMICLQFLRKLGLYIPITFNYEVLFYLSVVAGAASYCLLIVFITNKMKHIFNPERSHKITKYMGYLLIGLSIYFFYNAAIILFSSGQIISPLPGK